MFLGAGGRGDLAVRGHRQKGPFQNQVQRQTGENLSPPFHGGPRRIAGHREVGKDRAGFEHPGCLGTEQPGSTTSLSCFFASASLSPVPDLPF